MIDYEWNNTKRKTNLEKHGVDFAVAEGFDWANALVREDDRKEYGETRYVAIAPIGNRLYVMVWCYRGENIRIINLRKANNREEAYYGKKIVSG